MKISKLGILAASAMASLIGTAVFAAEEMAGAANGDKACYRSHCGKSVTGHEGKCGGTMVDGVKDQAACEGAGGAWTTATAAEAFKKK